MFRLKSILSRASVMLFKSHLVAAFAALAMAKPIRKRASKLEFFGVNESGAEFGTNIPGVLGTDVRPLSLSPSIGLRD